MRFAAGVYWSRRPVDKHGPTIRCRMQLMLGELRRRSCRVDALRVAQEFGWPSRVYAPQGDPWPLAAAHFSPTVRWLAIG
jgi:hypothetical protein